MTPQGLSLLKAHEGLRLTAYRDIGGVWTIGYGHTGPDVHEGLTITEERAEQLLLSDVRTAQEALEFVTVPLSEVQKDALTSFIFNVGVGAFRSSTLLRKLNAGDTLGAANEFLRWNKVKGDAVLGLSRRRAAERELFLSETPKATPEAPSMSPFVFPAFEFLKSVVPTLIRHFGKGEQSEQNAKTVETVVGLAKEAVGAVNEQELIETLKRDPDAVITVDKMVAANWLSIVEAGGGGIAGAREFNKQVAESGIPLTKMPAFWISLLLLVPVYALMADVFFVHPEMYSGELRTQIVTAVLALSTIVGAYWLGSSMSSRTKDELLARR